MQAMMARVSNAKLQMPKGSGGSVKGGTGSSKLVRNLAIVSAIVFVVGVHVFLFSPSSDGKGSIKSQVGDAFRPSARKETEETGGAAASASLRQVEAVDGSGGTQQKQIIVFEIANLGGNDGETGEFIVELEPSLAPIGVERFQELTDTKYWDGCRIFRVVSGFVAQFGMNGDPEVNKKWQNPDLKIKDDPVKGSNTRGTVTFATSGKDSRTTQIFINFGNNARLDGMGFSVIGKVSSGMDVVDRFYSGYGEKPNQGSISSEGNVYLERQFPKLSYIQRAYYKEDVAGS